MKTILKSLAAIIAVGAIAGGATFAYFTDTDTFNNNKLTAGTVKISVTNPNGSLPFDVKNLAPGDLTELRLDVENTGSLDVTVDGTAKGKWDFNGLDKFIKVETLEYWDGTQWATMGSNTTIAASKTLAVKLGVRFEKAADNAYQGKVYRASFDVTATQAANMP